MFGQFDQGPYAGLGGPSGGVDFPELLTLESAWPLVAAQPVTAPFLGVDGQGDAVTVDMESESPHVLITAGTGGGKSAIARAITVQHLARGGAAVVLDYKQISHRWTKGLEPNVSTAKALTEIGNALVELGREVHRRNSVVDGFSGPVDQAPVGPKILLVFEEMNSTMGALVELEKRLPKGVYGALQAFQDVVFMGRAAQVHVVCTAQLASWKAMRGADILANFNTRVLLQYDDTAWRWLVGGPFQYCSDAPGRGVVSRNRRAVETQFLLISEDEARRLVLGSRAAQALARSLTPRYRPVPRAWSDAERNVL